MKKMALETLLHIIKSSGTQHAIWNDVWVVLSEPEYEQVAMILRNSV